MRGWKEVEGEGQHGLAISCGQLVGAFFTISGVLRRVGEKEKGSREGEW